MRVILGTLAAMLVAASSLVWAVRPSLACSCAPGDPRARLAQADAAVAGRVISRDESVGMILTFEVEAAVKGDVGGRIEVRSDQSSCGLWMAEGERAGLFLRRDRAGNLHAGLCDTIDPDVLLRAAEPLPPPDGSGPPRFFMGGRFGETRLWILDGRGRTLAYGFGEGPTAEFAACPGGERAVEVYGDISFPRTGVRDLHTFELNSEKELWETATVADGTSSANLRSLGLRSNGIEAMACLAPTGDDAVYIAQAAAQSASTVVVRMRKDGSTLLWQGPSESAAISTERQAAFIVVHDRQDDVFLIKALDLETAEVTDVAAISAAPDEETRSLVPDPDGRGLAMVLSRASQRGTVRLVIVDMTVYPPSRVETALEGDTGHSEARWIDGERILVLPNNGASELRVLNRSLNQVGSVPVVAGLKGSFVMNGVLYALLFRQPERRVLTSFDLNTGKETSLREFDVSDVWIFAGGAGDLVDSPASEPAGPSVERDARGQSGGRKGGKFWAAIGAGGAAAIALCGAAWLYSRRRVTS